MKKKSKLSRKKTTRKQVQPKIESGIDVQDAWIAVPLFTVNNGEQHTTIKQTEGLKGKGKCKAKKAYVPEPKRGICLAGTDSSQSLIWPNPFNASDLSQSLDFQQLERKENVQISHGTASTSEMFQPQPDCSFWFDQPSNTHSQTMEPHIDEMFEPRPGCSFWADQPSNVHSQPTEPNIDEMFEPQPGCSFWLDQPRCVPNIPFQMISRIDEGRAYGLCPPDKMVEHALQPSSAKQVRGTKNTSRQIKDKERQRHKYHHNINYREHKKTSFRRKYSCNLNFKSKTIIKNKLNYATTESTKEALKEQSKRKYRTDSAFRECMKSQSKQKYATQTDFKKYVRSQSKQKYATQTDFKENVRSQSKHKYATQTDFKEYVRSQSKHKYATQTDFKEYVRSQSKHKYATQTDFKEYVRSQSKHKYATQTDFKEHVRSQSKHKYVTFPRWREHVCSQSKRKYAEQDEWRESVKKRSTDKYATCEKWRQHVKETSVERYRKNMAWRMAIVRKNRQRYQRNTTHRQKIKQACRVYYTMNRLRRIHGVRVRRQQIDADIQRLVDEFRSETSVGPEFICCVCHKLLFKAQVLPFVSEKYENKSDNAGRIANICATTTYLHECDAACQPDCLLASGPRGKQWICHTCNRKILSGQQPAEAYVNGLQLVPIPESLQGLNVLERQLISPRLPFVKMVALPKGGQHGVMGPMVSVPSDVNQTMNTLSRQDSDEHLIQVKLKRKLSYKGYSHYQFVSVDKLTEALNFLKDHNRHYNDLTITSDTFINPFPERTSDEGNEEPMTEQHEEEGADADTTENEGIQYDTCLQPIDVAQEVLDNTMERVYCVAPGEGNQPVRILRDACNEAMCFPVQFPDGNSTFSNWRDTRITLHRYLLSRIMNADNRFSSDITYLFYAQYLYELHQVISQVSIALRKGTRQNDVEQTVTAENLADPQFLRNILKADKAYKFMKPIRGTPPYWQVVLRDLFAMLRQLGKPTWFCSFSSGDFRWPEFINTMLRQQGRTQTLEELTWDEKCELVKNAAATSARMFDFRFRTFLNKVILSDAQPIGKVTDNFFRVEFQQRGSPHVHCFFWVEGAPQINVDPDQDVIDFINRYIHCDLPDEELDPVLHEIVSSVQQHSRKHSKTCKKKGTECRFNFPRPPSGQTFICKPKAAFEDLPNLSAEECAITAKNVLSNLKQTLSEHGHNSTEELMNAAGITQQAFEDASCVLAKRATIVLEREPDSTWINNYNPTLLKCWNANMDIQFITDAYACMMYVVSYISKAETEIGAVLENANQEAADGNLNAQQAMKKIGGVYLNHREVSAQEAVYRVCELHLKGCSRKVQFIPVGRNPVRMSLPLSVIQSRQAESEDVWLTSLLDKYRARPDNEEFSDMCLATFCSDYRVLSRSELNNTNRQHVATLAGDLGFVLKRTRTDSAIIRYPRFTADKQPEDYYISRMQLFLPHRTDDDLKPLPYTSYEEHYFNGVAQLHGSPTPLPVRDIVTTNSAPFNKLDHNIEENLQPLGQFAVGFEEAWATLCPESEVERLECLDDRRPDDRNAEEINIGNIPDLANTRTDTTDMRFEVLQPLFTRQDILPLLRSLNAKQKDVFYTVRQFCLDKRQGKAPEPFHLFLTGGAGVGKSHVVKCIFYEAQRILAPTLPKPDDIAVLMCAPTGTAAFNIGGATIHSALSINRNSKKCELLGESKINALRSKLGTLQILIIDEISMVSTNLLNQIHGRLRQIKQRTDHAPFGNVSVIAVGDFYQLTPVFGTSLCRSAPTDYVNLWNGYFKVVELTEVMRQRDDAQFAHFLNRIRRKEKSERLTEEDLQIVQQCESHNLPPETLHIFAKNDHCNAHNKKMLNTVCDTFVEITTQRFTRNPATGQLSEYGPSADTLVDLPNKLVLGLNTRVMLIRNLNTGDGLVNGVIGTVTRIVRAADTAPVTAIFVKFDHPKVGANTLKKQRDKEAVMIEQVTEPGKKHVVERQFPLKLAWACTAHKVQGITTDAAVVSLKNVFAAAGGYVALSRVTSLNGLKIIDFSEHSLYCPNNVSEDLHQMPQFPLICATGETTAAPGTISLVVHNTQGLFPHVDELLNNADMATSDVIALTETWLDDEYGPLIPGYNSHFQCRSNSYDNTEAVFQRLKNEGRGGVGIYCKVELNFHRTNLAVDNLEYIAVANEAESVVVISVYRTPAYPVALFAGQLRILLGNLETQPFENIIITGDFNEDLLSGPSRIYDLLETFGYKQIVNEPTTIYGSLLDHIYMKATIATPPVSVIRTYYSDHAAVKFPIRHD